VAIAPGGRPPGDCAIAHADELEDVRCSALQLLAGRRLPDAAGFVASLSFRFVSSLDCERRKSYS